MAPLWEKLIPNFKLEEWFKFNVQLDIIFSQVSNFTKDNVKLNI